MASHPDYVEKIDIGRVLSRGFQAIGSQLLVFSVLGVVLVGIPSAVMQYWAVQTQDPVDPLAAFRNVTFWISIPVMILSSFVTQAALARASILDLRSEPVEIGPALLHSLMLLPAMIGLAIVSTFGVAFGMLLLVVPGIMLLVRWIVAVPVLVTERVGVFGSLGRSAELTKGSRWWVFLLLGIYVIASSMISGIVGAAVISDGNSAGALMIVLSLIISVVTGIVSAAMLASLYIELRLIKEGGDDDRLVSIFA